MSESSNNRKRGIIGFFDVLGYKQIQINNQICGAISVVEEIRNVIEKCQSVVGRLSEISEKVFGEHVVFSDSILTFAPFDKDENENAQAEMFLSFCAGIVDDLFWAGLPVRGALAYGDLYVEKTKSGIYLAGAPIVESHEAANELDLSGCVVAESAEKFLAMQQILDDSDRQIGFIKYHVPIKNKDPKKMFMLNHRAFHKHEPEVTNEIILSRFAAFNKPINDDARRKSANTLEFFEACKPDACQPS